MPGLMRMRQDDDRANGLDGADGVLLHYEEVTHGREAVGCEV